MLCVESGSPQLPTRHYQLTTREELIVKKNTKSPICAYFGFNRAESTSQGVSTPSQSGDTEYKDNIKIIPDIFLSPFQSLISDLKIFPSAELTQNVFWHWTQRWPRRASAVPGSIQANCWGGMCRRIQISVHSPGSRTNKLLIAQKKNHPKKSTCDGLSQSQIANTYSSYRPTLLAVL